MAFVWPRCFFPLRCSHKRCRSLRIPGSFQALRQTRKRRHTLSATLSVGGTSAANAAGTINISVANGAWTETAVTGNNAPVAVTAVASGVSVSTSDTYLYVDATAAVKAWLSETTNSGFIIAPNDGTVTISIDSKRA